jgi:hypothetical protein
MIVGDRGVGVLVSEPPEIASSHNVGGARTQCLSVLQIADE